MKKYLLIFGSLLVILIVFLLGRSSILNAETIQTPTPEISEAPTEAPVNIPVYNQPVYQAPRTAPTVVPKTQSDYRSPNYQSTYTPAPVPTTYQYNATNHQAAFNQCMNDKRTQEDQCTQKCTNDNAGHEGENNNPNAYSLCLSNCNPNYSACSQP